MSRIDLYERVAGHLLVRAGRLRKARGGPDDAHEIRHLFAALTAGNSDPCSPGGADCHLDKALLTRLHDATFGDDHAAEHPWMDLGA